jgi:hypothetical protein
VIEVLVIGQYVVVIKKKLLAEKHLEGRLPWTCHQAPKTHVGLP